MSQFSRLTSNLGRRMISSIAAKNGSRRSAMPSFRPPSRTFTADGAQVANPFAHLPSFAPVNSSLLASSPVTRVTTLPNGLRVASEANGGHTATIGVWMDIGSRFEKAEDNGVAHFLEHLTFKGTPRRTRYQLESEIENMGGHLNAYTSREQTVYYAKVFSSDVGNAFDILSDILKNSKLDTEDINRERDVIIREMQEVDANLGEVIFDRLHETAYRGTALSRTILGSIENIRTINQQQLKNYVATHYTAPHMVISGSGAVKHEELVKFAEKYFGDIPKAAPAGKAPYFEPAHFTGSDILVRNDELPEAHVALAFQTAGWVDPSNFPLMVIQTMLGSWDNNTHGGQHSSSPLVSVSAEQGLANRFTTFNTQYSDTGLFGVYFIAEPTCLMAFSAELMRNISKLSRDVDPARLEEAKTVLKMTMLSHLDGNTAIAEDIGRQLLVYGRRMHPTELLARIDAVDEEAIKATAQRFFWDQDVAIAGLGNLYELPDYNWYRSRTYLDRF